MDMAVLLLDAGTDIEFRDFAGRTPLHCAVGCEYLEMAEMLLQRGADVNAVIQVRHNTI
jgi:ankyrin repeat protein